jgi:radical SAM protein with 4Fe4S-binding SPASM domain
MEAGVPKIEARDLRGKRRVDLVKSSPIDTPLTLFIEPTNACNFRCSYCPTGDTPLIKSVGRKNKLMDWDLFCKIVNDIEQFPRRLKMINLYKDGESLLHPRFVDMVRILKAADVSDRVWVKTNGSLLNPEYNERLANSGLDMLGISVQHVNAQGFYDVAKVKIDYDIYRANILDLYKRRGRMQVSIKIADIGLSADEIQKFYDDFSDRCDFIAVEGLHGWSASEYKDWKLGTNQSFDGTPRQEKIVCPLVLHMLAINSDGTVSLCNDDWMHAHQLGDLNKESLYDVWHGNKLREFRVMHLEGRRHENAACKACDYMHVLPDNFDPHRFEIRDRIISI